MQVCWVKNRGKDFINISCTNTLRRKNYDQMNKLKEAKCVVWDLDNTIWDGILTESNAVKLKPGIEKIIRCLDDRGIIQSIASKNNFQDAWDKLKAFSIDHFFLFPQISWNAKSYGIQRIQKDLNIGLDTFVFIDDQEFERNEVASELPEVECLDAVEYADILKLPRLNPRFITNDSRRRRLMYLENIERNQEESAYQGPQEAFLASLNMKVIISEAVEEDLKRAEELTIRTNQLNATGLTYDFDELNAFCQSDHHSLLMCELTDRFGSYGKIGLALIENYDNYAHLRIMLMSCRVISRGVGTIFMNYIMQKCAKQGRILRADFKQTSRNKMMYITYKFANFHEIQNNEGNIIFENNLSKIQEIPPYVSLEIIENVKEIVN